MKRRGLSIWLCGAMMLAAGAVAVMLYAALTTEHARQEYHLSDPLVPVSLQGRFRIGNDAWQVYPPQNMDVLRTVGEEPIAFTGQTLAAIPQGRTVFVCVRHIRASLQVNGMTLFEIGGETSKPAFTRTPGALWASFVSPGISPGDVITITVERVACNSHPYQVELFLEDIQYGSVWELMKMELAKVWWSIPLAVLFIAMSLLLVMLAILFAMRKEKQFALQATFLAGVYICISLWAMVSYEVLSLFIPFPTAILVWETFSLLFCGVFIMLYIATYLTGIRLFLAHLLTSGVLLLFFICVGLQLYGNAELFVVQHTLHLVLLCTVVFCIILSLFERRVNRQESMQILIPFIPLCAISSMDILVSALGPLTKGFFACVGFLITAGLQVFLLLNTAYKKMEQANRLERELVESRIAISLSQIRPHFLYNVLTGIQYLCGEDPPRAEQAMADFTIFLRGNLDTLSSPDPIPLMQELEHVRHYLKLEQLRYGDRLRVEWELNEADFRVPPLSVQPLAENAVRWGMREDGLTIHITTHRTEEGYVVTVEDDGLGFDTTVEQPPHGQGVGLSSTRTRVRDCYNGSLTLISRPGAGTLVTLLFPHRTHSRSL